MRKFLIGLITLAIVLAVYLLYNRLSRTPSIDTHPGAEFAEAVADGNIAGLDDEVGRIGPVGVGPVRKAKYIILNEDKQVEREFGFEKLLHEVGDLWELQKPYMNIYRRNFECYVTADRGKVQVETAVGKTTPKDATFTGNVIVHIVPKDSRSIKESFVYLDEVVFLSDRSQLATGGAIRFVSEDAQMTGTGMELVYNERTERLEYFRIVDLESLHMRVKSFQKTFVAGGDKQPEKPADTVARPETKQPVQTVVAAAPQRAQAPPRPAPQRIEPTQGEYYKCILSKNVVVDSPEQLVFAEQQLCINNIFWSKASSSRSDKAGADVADGAKKTAATTAQAQARPGVNDAKAQKVADEKTAVTTAQARPAAGSTEAQNVTVPMPSEPNMPSEQFIDVVVTCDGGVLLVPMDSARAPDDSAEDVAGAAASDAKRPDVLDDDTQRTKFFTRRIDYDASTGDAVATGVSELTFYASPIFQSESKTATETPGPTAAEANEPPVPVKLVARQGAKFLEASNQVIFEGDCLCTMPQAGLTGQQNATFSAPNITVNVSQDKSKPPDIFAAGPAELVFYMQDSNDAGAGTEPVPVRINAQRQARFLPASNQIVFEGDCLCTMPQKGLTPAQNCTFSSPQFTVRLPKDKSKQPDIFAAGPAELNFYAQAALQKSSQTAADVNDSAVRKTQTVPLPAKVTAQKQVRFLGSSNQIVFEGDCRYSMIQEDPNALVKYILSAEQIVVDLPSDTNDRSSESTVDIKRLTANGGTVKLTTVRKAGQKLLGGIELECTRAEYDAERQLFVATGPGVINLNNAEDAEPNKPASGFGLRKPCWAFLRDFDTLKYFMRENRIVADAGQQRLLIDYFPVVDGQYGEHIKAIASHMEALLIETPDGKTELSTLIASGGVDYEDDDNLLVGGKLLYDHAKSLMKVSGDASQPCYLNGALVDEIEYDLKTRHVRFEIIGPGALRTNR